MERYPLHCIIASVLFILELFRCPLWFICLFLLELCILYFIVSVAKSLNDEGVEPFSRTQCARHKQ